jgi:AAA+ ATPase superfamily predicted ATPase
VTGGFVGRSAELDRLSALLGRVGSAARDLPGVAVTLRGRRRVGKSRLVEVFCERSGVPFVFFQASQGQSPTAGRAAFAEAIRWSSLPGKESFAEGMNWPSWSAFFRQLADALPTDRTSVLVIDELPWLLEADPSLEGELQTAWDRGFSRKHVLLVLIGSDLAMMERLDDYQRPFHQRATVMVLPPLNPAEVGGLLDCSPADAIDAYLVTGGLPLVCQEWERGLSLWDFLRGALCDSTSALLVSGERSLAAEFPAELQAQAVLSAIGSGQRTWKRIRDDLITGSGRQIADSSLANALRLLEAKRVIAVDAPLSARSSGTDRRYRIADPYLRFYLAFLKRGLPLVERGRGDLALLSIERSWQSWRGTAVEPVVREALLRLLPGLGLPEVTAVGGWWTRSNNVEIDLVGMDSGTGVALAGSIKWHESRSFDRADYASLLRDVVSLPGAKDDMRLIAVARTGTATADAPITCLGPRDLLTAWQ